MLLLNHSFFAGARASLVRFPVFCFMLLKMVQAGRAPHAPPRSAARSAPTAGLAHRRTFAPGLSFVLLLILCCLLLLFFLAPVLQDGPAPTAPLSPAAASMHARTEAHALDRTRAAAALPGLAPLAKPPSAPHLVFMARALLPTFAPGTLYVSLGSHHVVQLFRLERSHV